MMLEPRHDGWRLRAVRLLAALAAAVAFSLPSGTSTASQSGRRFSLATAPYRFVWPRDHGAHDTYRTEWWYFTGHVTTAQGRRFGYELTFFRVGLRPGRTHVMPGQSRWRGNAVFPAHFALTDERGAIFFHVDRFAREALGMGAATVGSLDVRAQTWTLRGQPLQRPDLERMVLHADEPASEGRNAIDFVQIPQKAPAIHGAHGVSRKAACAACASHYYSYSRLRTSGTLTYRGEALRVSGTSWMDHEFGSGELAPDQRGWDWFSLQLDDGRELMLYRLRQKDGSVTPQSSGSVIERDGTVRFLPLREFSIETTGGWTSPHTGAHYPSGWRVRVPSAHVDATLVPVLRDQELVDTSGGGISYWEGAVDVRATQSTRALGMGYVELTGYAGTLSI